MKIATARGRYTGLTLRQAQALFPPAALRWWEYTVKCRTITDRLTELLAVRSRVQLSKCFATVVLHLAATDKFRHLLQLSVQSYEVARNAVG